MARPHSLLLGTLTTVALGTVLSIGCGNSDATIPPAVDAGVTCTGDCSCVGATCTCQTGGHCTFGAVGAGGDGGLLPDGGAAPGAPNNVTYDCSSKNQCDSSCGTGCTTTCAGQSTCTGSCSSNCTSTCGGTSNCTLETGTNSTVTCEGGSNCTVTVDTGSTVNCTGNSTCTIDCPKGGCTASCGGSSGCTVKCGGTTACDVKCNGKSVSCAAGSTCDNPCGGGSGGDAGSPPDAGHGK